MTIELQNSAPGPSTQRPIKRKIHPGSPDGEPYRQRPRFLNEHPSSSALLGSPSHSRPPVVHHGRRLPRHVLLLLLPQLLSHPPSHPWYSTSVLLSLSALRKCLALDGLTPDVECRACLTFAETGIKVVKEGLQGQSHNGKATSLGKNVSIENEVENVIARGLLLCQSHPRFAVSKHLFTLMQAQLAYLQRNTKFSRSILKRLSSNLTHTYAPSGSSFQAQPAAPSWLVYTTYLTSISHALESKPPDNNFAFHAIQELQKAAQVRNDNHIILLACVLRLRTLLSAEMWDEVGICLASTEKSLGLSYAALQNPAQRLPNSQDKEKQKIEAQHQTFIFFDDPMEGAMALHILLIGVIYYTHLGSAVESSPRLSHLHALMDSDALTRFPNGSLNVKLTSGTPLTIQVTHPKVLFHLTYLVSSTAKRDAVGRKPKRKVFAIEGLKVWDRDAVKSTDLPSWAGILENAEVDETMVKMKADLLSELVAVTIMRSEFEEASNYLDALVAHARSFNVFHLYAPRITLHHAHLAHALGEAERARDCYRAAAHIASDGSFVRVAALAGQLGLAIGFSNRMLAVKDPDDGLVDMAHQIVQLCQGMGGALQSLVLILQAVVSGEILASKSYLRSALQLASKAQDNHLRALILALISSLYLRTAGEHAKTMLETCGQLANGLGAPAKAGTEDNQGSSQTSSSSDQFVISGNVPLSLWVGQRFLELYRQQGNDKKAEKQERMNEALENAMEQLGLQAHLFTESS